MDKERDWGLLVMRVVLGAVFIAHGWPKVMGIAGTISFFGNLGLPEFLAYVVAGVEVLGGAAMILGLWTQWAGRLLAVDMLGAIYFVKWPRGFVGGYEFELALLALALGLSLVGPGSLTIRKLLKK